MAKLTRIGTAVTLLLASVSAMATDWQIIDLGTVGHKYSSAVGINNLGQVIGYGWDNDTSNCNPCDAFMSDANGANVRIVGTPGTQSSARYINNKGVVIILSQVNFPSSYSMTGPNGVGLTALDASTTSVSGINDSGQYVGVTAGQGNFISGANGVGKTYLNFPTQYGPFNIGSFNNNAQVAGVSYPASVDPYGPTHGPTRYAFFTGANGSGFTQITNAGNDTTIGSMNNAGQMVLMSNPDTHFASGRGSYLVSPNGSSLTPFTNGFNPSRMNNTGSFIDDTSMQALVGGTLIFLPSLPAATAAGWSNLQPAAINDYNQIAGTGIINNEPHAFLLTPPQ